MFLRQFFETAFAGGAERGLRAEALANRGQRPRKRGLVFDDQYFRIRHNSMRTMAPPSGLLPKVRLPPWRRTMFRATLSPSPIPPSFSEYNVSAPRRRAICEKPGPVSAKLMSFSVMVMESVPPCGMA